MAGRKLTVTVNALVAVCLASAAVSAWTFSPMSPPMFLSYVRPRRAPAPAHGPAFGPAPPAQGSMPMPLYPARTLSFSGYFSGAGVPQAQSGDPYALSWGQPLGARGSIYPCNDMCKSNQEESAAATESPPLPDESANETGAAPVANPTAEPGPGPEVTVPYGEESGGAGDRDAKADRPASRKAPARPSYPSPPEPPRPPQNPPASNPNPSPAGEPEDGSDRGGYGTINAWFPLMFSGGWPMNGVGNAGRGYGAPNSSPPSYGAPNNAPPSYSPPSNSPSSNGASQGAGPSPQGGGFYPVAIANSFSTGRNAVASSTATAYGGAPSGRS